MASFNAHSPDLGFMDVLSQRDTPLHRLDPRVKLTTTLAFLVLVVSFRRYEVSALVPYFLYPVALVARGNIPIAFMARKLLFVAPFAVLVGLFNPLFDRAPAVLVGGWAVSGGWLSFASILMRFVLTVGATLALIAVTGFTSVCAALGQMGAPRALVTQLMFLYRYLFVLVDQVARVARARALRSVGRRGRGIGAYGPLVGSLFLRTLDRAQRIHRAMTCRGYSGVIRIDRPKRLGARDVRFLLGWVGVFVLFRWVNVPEWVGQGVLS